jgi:hypothetical protein
MLDFAIEVAPVINRNGVLYWTAGVVQLAPDGWTNTLPDTIFAKGATPAEAVETLIPILGRGAVLELAQPAPKRKKQNQARAKRTPSKSSKTVKFPRELRLGE